MEHKRSRLCRVAATVLAAWLIGGGGQTAAQEQDMPLVLAHRFTIAESPAWSEVAVELTPEQWRVGGPDGPVASAWQLQIALGGLIAVEVGGCCSAWVDGPTAYPCGFTLSGFELLGLDVDREPASASPAAASMPDRTKTDAFACAQQDTKARGGPMRQGAMRFASIRPWLHNAGDHTGALGTTLRFQFRGVVNHLHASKIDRASGVVILRALQRGRAS
jgi:hypothetical protein